MAAAFTVVWPRTFLPSYVLFITIFHKNATWLGVNNIHLHIHVATISSCKHP